MATTDSDDRLAAQTALAEIFLTPAGNDDPYARYSVLHERSPVTLSGDGGIVLVRYHDCQSVLRDNRMGKNFDPTREIPGAGAHDTELVAYRRKLAEQRNRDWSLMAALVDPEIVVYRYTSAGGATRYFSEDELAEQQNPENWRQGRQIDTRGGSTGQTAEEVGLARYLAEDFDEVRALYHLEGEPVTIKPNWAHSFIETLASMSTWVNSG